MSKMELSATVLDEENATQSFSKEELALLMVFDGNSTSVTHDMICEDCDPHSSMTHFAAPFTQLQAIDPLLCTDAIFSSLSFVLKNL